MGLLTTAMAKTVALIPLRGGSKAIPDKNIKIISGKPLCFWIIEECLKSQAFSEVYVSTDSERITDLIENNFPDVVIIPRPEELATDTATTESVMLHFLEWVDFDILFTIQATSPLTTADHFNEAIFQFALYDYDSLFTSVEMNRFFWKDDGIELKPINYHYYSRPRRQDMRDFWVMENGAFYITKRKILETVKCRLGGKIGSYLMGPEHMIELDSQKDWDVIKILLQKKNTKI